MRIKGLLALGAGAVALAWAANAEATYIRYNFEVSGDLYGYTGGTYPNSSLPEFAVLGTFTNVYDLTVSTAQPFIIGTSCSNDPLVICSGNAGPAGVSVSRSSVSDYQTVALSFDAATPTIDGIALPTASNFLGGTFTQSLNHCPLITGYACGLINTTVRFNSSSLLPDSFTNAIGIRTLISTIPEPASWAMMISGFGVVGAAMRRRGQAPRYAERAV